MREYLLSEKKSPLNIENHIVFIDKDSTLNGIQYDYNSFCSGTWGIFIWTTIKWFTLCTSCFGRYFDSVNN